MVILSTLEARYAMSSLFKTKLDYFQSLDIFLSTFKTASKLYSSFFRDYNNAPFYLALPVITNFSSSSDTPCPTNTW